MAKTHALRGYLKQNKMSVAKLALRSGVPRSTINGWLNDGSMPGADHAAAVSAATGGLVTVQQLVEGAKIVRRAS